MRIEDGNKCSDSGRTTIDRQAVTAAGQLLMSAIWLEHRVRRFSTHFSVLPSQRSSAVSAASSSAAQKTDQGVLVHDAYGA